MSTRRQPGPGWVAVLRDIVSLTLPWVLIFKQAGIVFAPPAEVSEPILWLAGAMLGVPGVAQILALRFGAGTGTGESPPRPVSAGSLPGSSSIGPSEVDA